MILFGKMPLISMQHFARGWMSVVKFHLPDLGQKIKEGTIKKMYVKEGDKVTEFQKLADVASDKQFTQITAMNAGTIHKVYYKEEDVCQVGQLFLEIDTDSTEHQKPDNSVPSSESTTTASPKPAETITPNPEVVSSQGSFLATPYVRGLLRKHNIPWQKVHVIGPNRRITQTDVENYIQNQMIKSQTSSSVDHTTSIPVGNTSEASSKIVTMSAFEKGMQKSMTESCTIPHLYLQEQFDITEAQKMRGVLKAGGKKVTLMGILVKTFSMAMRTHPKINATYEPHKDPFAYTLYSGHHISVAIDSANGLVVPNIKNVQFLSLTAIQIELQRLRGLSLEGKLTARELQGGTVCLSNIGTIAGISACPLILPPQVCIVAIGKMHSVARYWKGELSQRKVLNVTYGCDHRVIDGATVARFSNEWKALVENPYLLMSQLA